MKNKRPLTPDQLKDLITYADGGHEPRSWKDYGFNDYMEKPATSGSQNKRPWCEYNPLTWTFTLEKKNGETITLTFRKNQKGEISDQAILFEVGYNLWTAGIEEFERAEVLKRIEEKANIHKVSREINGNWFKQARRNLTETIRDYKLSPDVDLSAFVKAFHLDKAKKGKYCFLIIRPNLPSE